MADRNIIRVERSRRKQNKLAESNLYRTDNSPKEKGKCLVERTWTRIDEVSVSPLQ
jgi:hypothetical protein